MRRGVSWAAVVTIASASASAVWAEGWRADPALVEGLSERQPDRIYREEDVPAYELPDVMRFADGRVVGSAAEWRERREEIFELYRGHVFGRSPGRPEKLTFAVVGEDRAALGRAATMRRVRIRSEHEGRGHEFGLVVFVPNAVKGRVPTFLLINNRGPEHFDETGSERSGFWPVGEMVRRGYGMAVFHNGEVAPDDPARRGEGVMRMYEGEGARRAVDAWGTIGAWAWGASRCMDYLETDGRVDARRVGVVGHSRGGKTALWAAAQDERFGMAVANNSGNSGAAIHRRLYGERIRHYTRNAHWFVDDYKARYADREGTLPVDQHMLLALVAPRALYVTSATEDLSADPRGEFLGLAHASGVYGLFGQPGIGLDEMPGADRPMVKGVRGYHVRTGKHDLTEYDWMRFADFADHLWGR